MEPAELPAEREDTSRPHSPLVALGYRDFRLYWLGQLVSTAGSMMQTAAVAWQVYLLSHSAIALGLIGLFRIIPLVLLSLAGGVVADVLNRRRLMMATQTALLLVSGALAVLTLTGVISIWMIYALTVVASAALAFDSPARQSLVPALVPRVHLSNALSLNSTAWQVASVLGPSLAGVFIATSGVAAVYILDAVSFLAVIAALAVIRPPAVKGAIQQISLQAALEGLRFVRRTPILLGTLFLDFIATFFGTATALLPIFASTVLHVGSVGYGILYAAPSIGAIAAGIAMTIYVGRMRRQGLTIVVAVAAYSICTIAFGASHIFVVSVLALAGVGGADTVSMILRQTVRQLVTPDALRGRMSSVGMLFFMGGPQLGDIEAGVVARAIGAPASVVLGGIAALLATVYIGLTSESLRAYRGHDHSGV